MTAKETSNFLDKYKGFAEITDDNQVQQVVRNENKKNYMKTKKSSQKNVFCYFKRQLLQSAE